MESFLLWAAEVRTQKPDGVLHEITVIGTSDLLSEHLGDIFGIESFIISPLSDGWPGKRPRRYCILWNLETTVFDGSNVEYLNMFGVRPALTGSAFLLEDPEVRRKYQLKRAAGHGFHWRPNEVPENVPASTQFTASELLRLEDAMTNLEWSMGQDGTAIVDVEQNDRFCRPGPFFPCMVKHGTLVHLPSKQIFSIRECLALMGEPLFEPLRKACGHPCLFEHVVDEIPETALKRIAGNAQHVCSIGSLAMYMFACLRLKAPADIELDKYEASLES